MTRYDYETVPGQGPNLGLIVLQVDERIEADFRRLLPSEANLYVSRVPSGLDLTRESLGAMAAHLTGAALLLPGPVRYDAVGYGCTSGAAQIGPGKVADLVGRGVACAHVSEPVSALLTACRALGLRRLALLSPYVEPVSAQLRRVLAGQGIETPVFGSFDEAEEARVARIAPRSTIAAARDLAARGGVDGLFLSCTNLDTLDAIAPLEAETGLPVLSSNLVLAWHMCSLARAGAGMAANLRAHGAAFRLAMV